MMSSAVGLITRGHRIASGQHRDVRFPQGTLAMQSPFFKQNGFDITRFFKGTLNISLLDADFKLGRPSYFFPLVQWSTDLTPENFSFYQCSLTMNGCSTIHESFVYWPHPSTKPEFKQDPSVLEVIAPFIEEAHYGDEITITADSSSINFSANI